MDRHERAYRALLVAYPLKHRRDFGDPMTQLFVDRLRDEGGGARSVLIWAHTLIDLTKSAFAERLETTMKSFRTGWWRILALPLAVFVAVAGVGLPFEPQETAGPNWLAGAIAYAVVTVVGLGLVITGLMIRRRNRKVGSSLVAVGVMPGFPMTLMIWFPPVALVGALSIVISTMAFLDAPKGTLEKVETPA